MKKLLLLSIVFITSFSCFSQAYKPMLSSSSEWYYFSNGTGGNIGTNYFSNEGDTIINGLIYSKINEINLTGPSNPDDGFQGTHLLREDSINRLVYFIDFNNDTALLYDFNLLPGDTFFLPPFYGGMHYILDSITYDFNNLVITKLSQTCHDSTFTNTSLLKIFNFNNGVVWIEGIGALGNLVSNYFLPFECSTHLVCHYNNFNNKDFYIKESVAEINGECFTNYTTGIKNNRADYLSFIIYPNPISSGSLIYLEGKDLTRIEILNLQGQLVYEAKLIDNKIAIDLPIGIYLLKAFDSKEKHSARKLVVN